MDVRHGGDVVEDPREAGDVAKLIERDLLDLARVRPGHHVDVASLDGLDEGATSSTRVALGKANRPETLSS